MIPSSCSQEDPGRAANLKIKNMSKTEQNQTGMENITEEHKDIHELETTSKILKLTIAEDSAPLGKAEFRAAWFSLHGEHFYVFKADSRVRAVT